MDVRDAVADRRSVRAYLPRPVEIALLERIALGASRAASGGNLQPWHVDILVGESLAKFKAIMHEALETGRREPLEYPVYPAELDDPYQARRFGVGEAMYREMAIPREDKSARRAWFARNYQFFDAPAALFVTVNRYMGPPQWSDLGQYLAYFSLLAVEEGLATCSQECWAVYPETVRAFLATPPERMLFCGMAIGYEDKTHPVNRLRATRCDAAEWLNILS
jgi:nitroreductase